MMIVVYVSIGLIVGSLSGVMGIGGGILIVPALIWLCGFDAHKAAGTSLAILIPPIGLPAAVEAYRKNEVDLMAAIWIAAAFMVGALTSRLLLEYVSEAWVRVGVGLLMIFVAVRLMVWSDSETAKTAVGLAAALMSALGLVFLKLFGRRPLAAQPREEAHQDYQI